MMKKKNALILCFSPLATDARIQRQLFFLGDRWKITAVGKESPQAAEVEFIDCGRTEKTLTEKFVFALRALSLAYEAYYWNLPVIKHCLKALANRDFDLVIANDIITLPLALKIAKGTKVIYDAHEYAPKENEHLWQWRLLQQGLLTYLCKAYMPEADQLITVSEGLAEEYEKNVGRKPSIIMNLPFYHELKPSHASSNCIRMIHHGLAMPSRKIELLIKMFDFLDDRFELDLLLVPSSEAYMNKLRELARPYPKIRFLPLIPFKEIVSFISKYDIGTYLLEPNTFNEMYALPNKLFEFIQGRLMLGIGPSPEMARIVNHYRCGIVAEDFRSSSMARALMKLDKNIIMDYKWRSDAAAKELCAEESKIQFLEIVDQAINQEF